MIEKFNTDSLAASKWAQSVLAGDVDDADFDRLTVQAGRFGVKDNGAIGVSVSIGATLSRPDDTVDTIVRRADNLMYRCKKAGRNCVCIDTSTPPKKRLK